MTTEQLNNLIVAISKLNYDIEYKFSNQKGYENAKEISQKVFDQEWYLEIVSAEIYIKRKHPAHHEKSVFVYLDTHDFLEFKESIGKEMYDINLSKDLDLLTKDYYLWALNAPIPTNPIERKPYLDYFYQQAVNYKFAIGTLRDIYANNINIKDNEPNEHDTHISD